MIHSHRYVGVFIIIVTLFTLEFAMKSSNDTLSNHSMDLIKIFSKSWDSPSFAVFMQNCNLYGFYIFNTLWAIYVLTSGPKIGQILWVNSIGSGVVITSLLSCFYRKLRPSWNDITTTILGSNKDYANPSFFVTITGTITFGALVLHFFHNDDFCLNNTEKESLEKSRRSLAYSQISRILIVLLAVAIYGFLAFSELYIEASTIGDVIHGCLLSLICVCAFFFLFRSRLIEYYKSALTETMVLKNSFMTLGFIFLITIAIIYMTYGIFRTLDMSISPAIIEHVKSKIKDFTKETPLNASIINAGLGFVAIGANLGLLVSPQVIGIDPTRVTLNTGFHKKFFRLFFVIFMIMPLPFAMILYIPLSPVTVSIWFKAIIPSAAFGFSFFTLSDFLMARLRLLPKIESKEPKEDKKNVIITIEDFDIKKENGVPLLI